MRPHLLYSASSPVPLTKCSTYITESHYRRLVPCGCLPKRRNFNSVTAFAIFPCNFCRLYQCHKNQRLKQSPAAKPHVGGRHTHNGVLPGAPKGSFATLLSPPQCHVAFGTMPHTLAPVDHSPVCRPRTLPPTAMRRPNVGLWRENLT
jgi:hypothetical protein